MKLNLNLNNFYLRREDNNTSRTNRTSNTNLNIHEKVSRKRINPQIVQKCLYSLDVFRDLLEGIPQKSKNVVKDVCKVIQLQNVNDKEIIYNIGDKVNSIFLCLEGAVSISIKQEKSVKQNQQSSQREPTKKNEEEDDKEKCSQEKYVEIDSLVKGEGFGSAEFLSKTRRSVRASSTGLSLIGKIQISSFQQVFQSYKMRVFYKLREMFLKCPLFQKLSPKTLQFIVNNTKPITTNISHKIIEQGQYVQRLYLVKKGQISLWKQQYSPSPKGNKLKYCPKRNSHNLTTVKKISMGLMEQGSFLGDLELVLNKKFQFYGIVQTEKAQLYYCDKRIILSQITNNQLNSIKNYYSKKNQFKSVQLKKNISLNQQLQKQQKLCFLPKLSKNQMLMKTIINRRYSQDNPSLIGRSSPLDIQKMVNRKAQRIKTQPLYPENPILQIFQSKSKKKRSYSPQVFKPLVIVKNPEDRSITQMSCSNIKFQQQSKLQPSKSTIIQIKSQKMSLNTMKNGSSENLSRVKKNIGNSKPNENIKTFKRMMKQIETYSKKL